MARIDVPRAVSDRIMGFGPELWAPGQIVHRVRSGAFTEPLLRASPRWRGVFQIGLRASWRVSSGPIVGAVELFLAQMSRPGTWCEMPWGGDPPRYPVPRGAYVGMVTVAETAAAGFSIRRTSGADTGPLEVGQWVCAVGRCAIVREVGMEAAGVQAGVRTLPTLPVIVGNEVRPAGEMRMRFPSNADDTIALPRGASFAGPWAMPWEEYLGAP